MTPCTCAKCRRPTDFGGIWIKVRGDRVWACLACAKRRSWEPRETA